MTASLAEMRREVEDSAPLSALASIERRLEEISAKLDQEFAGVAPSSRDRHPFDDLARQIDDVSRQAHVDSSRLEASLNALNAKLEFPAFEAVAGSPGEPGVSGGEKSNARPITAVLADLVEKLDREPPPQEPPPSVDLSALDDALRQLVAEIEAGVVRSFDRRAVDQLAAEVEQRLETLLARRTSPAAISEQLDRLDRRLEQVLERVGGESIGPVVDSLSARLREIDGIAAQFRMVSDLADELAGLRSDQATAERRREVRLQAIQGALDTLMRRLLENDEASQPSSAEGHASVSRDRGQLRAAAIDARGLRSTPGHNSDDGFERPSTTGDDLLLEPGASAPQGDRDPRETAGETDSWRGPAISAHIAAARRAAQAALAEPGEPQPPDGSPPTESGVERAAGFYARHKRSLLLAAAVLMVAAGTSRLVGALPHFVRNSTMTAPVKTAVLEPSQTSAIAAGGVNPTVSVDTAPTGSIGADAKATGGAAGTGAAAPELLAVVPPGLPQPLRDAVISGSPSAAYELGRRLLEGRALPLDQRSAALWFERAASAGYPPAQFRIGTLYQKGVGVPRDPAAAKRWYTQAAEAGNARAAHNLAVMNAEPVGEAADYAAAAKWFRRAADMGVRDSQFNLATLYARGLGVPQDLRQSWVWFSLAAAQGDPEAGSKRDEVAAKMDSSALAAAADELAKFRPIKPAPAANDVVAPSGGWGDKTPTAPSGEILAPLEDGRREPAP
jgi:localization factor PodJL